MDDEKRVISIPMTGDLNVVEPILTGILKSFADYHLETNNVFAVLDGVICFIAELSDTTPRDVAMHILERSESLNMFKASSDLTQAVAVIDIPDRVTKSGLN